MLVRGLIFVLVLMGGLPTETRMPSRHGAVIVRAVTADAGKLPESQLEFLDTKGKTMCVIDYSSKDSAHGYTVVKAEWTPDQKYFVWSLQSSGGHSPWHYPTRVFEVKSAKVYALDDVVPGPGISRGDFQLRRPNTIETAAYDDKRPFIMGLDELQKLSPSGNEFHCGGGQTLNFGEPE